MTQEDPSVHEKGFCSPVACGDCCMGVVTSCPGLVPSSGDRVSEVSAGGIWELQDCLRDLPKVHICPRPHRVGERWRPALP